MQYRWFPVLGWVGLISRGPVWSDDEDVACFRRHLNELGHIVLINGDGEDTSALRALGLIQVLTPATIAVLDLEGDAQTRRARMHQKWRNRLRRAEDAPLKVTRHTLSGSAPHWLFEAEREQRRARGYKGLPPEIAQAYAQANPGAVDVFEARLNGSAVAGMAFCRHGSMATYFIGHTFEAGRANHAHTRLLAEAADDFAKRGVTALDLGLIDTVTAPGLARFKLGSGARPRQLSGTWLYSKWLSRVLQTGGLRCDTVALRPDALSR